MSIRHLKPRPEEELKKSGYYERITDKSKIYSIEFDGIDYSDAPDFCDAFISYARYEDRDLTETELDELNEDRDFVYEKLMDYLY